jgi:hypothetical protein
MLVLPLGGAGGAAIFIEDASEQGRPPGKTALLMIFAGL